MPKKRIEVEEEFAETVDGWPKGTMYDDLTWSGSEGDHGVPGVREFESGATRDTDEGKPEYAGFESPEVIRRFGEYMHEHRLQKDGTLRASDNWKNGFPREVYVQSMFRHFVDVWELYNADQDDKLEIALCALRFNVQGLLYEVLKGR